MAASCTYGLRKTLYNHRKRWSEAGVFTRTMEGPAVVGAEPRTVMIDTTYRKVHRFEPASCTWISAA